MIFEKAKSHGISANSYFVGSDENAFVIDPRRDCSVYIETAAKHGIKITHIFETHRNEDFATGALELANATGAKICHGPGLDWGYGSTLTDNQTFLFGNLRVTALYTPGHTDESVSFVVTDLATGDVPVMVFTGDALFVNDVGRTDLYGPEQTERLAGNLFDSIFRRLLPLGDGVIICPAHGGGSVCGVRIADREESTTGTERRQNPVLHLIQKDDFVKYKLSEKPERPPYFRRMEQVNLAGPRLLGKLPKPPAMPPDVFNKHISDGALIVDTREPAAFGGAHISGAYSIWLEGLAAYAGWVLPYDRPLLLVVDDEPACEKAVRYLVRLGYDSIAGYLAGGIANWYTAGLPIERLELISANELKNMLDRKEDITVLDTRRQEEWEEGHIEGAVHIFVGHLEQRSNEIPKGKPTAVYCSAGYRSGLASSILLRGGQRKVYNVAGGINAWLSSGLNTVKG
jgi:hydroxyacylglutathione hydrolase